MPPAPAIGQRYRLLDHRNEVFEVRSVSTETVTLFNASNPRSRSVMLSPRTLADRGVLQPAETPVRWGAR
jgi:hypothetical protein